MKQDLASPTPTALRSDRGSILAALRALLPISFPSLGRRVRFCIPTSDAPLVMDAVESNDWGTLACLPRFDSPRSAGSECLRFLIEFTPGAASEPAYLTVTGPAGDGAGRSILPARFGRKTFVARRPIEPEDVQTMVALLPEMMAASERSSLTGQARPSDVVVLLRRLGLLRTGGSSDFRDEAVRVSAARPHNADGSTSTCVLVDARGPGRAAWRQVAPFVVAALVFSAAFNVALILVMAGLASFVVAGLLVMLALIASVLIIKSVSTPRVEGLRAALAVRPGSLLGGREELPSVPFKLQGGRMHYVSPLCPDDVGICVFDAPNRRILLEGLGYRYVIRGQDLRQLSPLRPVADVPVMLEYVVGGEVSLGFSLKLVQASRRSSGGGINQPLHQLLSTLQPQGAADHASEASGG